MSKRSTTKLESEDYLFSQEYDPGQTVILGRSILDLYRAFSNSSMVAFVGSGTSVALGYPTWEGFAKALMNHVIEQCDITLDGRKEEPAYAQSMRLLDAVKKYKILVNRNDPKRKPVLFDMIALASEMAAELQRIRSALGIDSTTTSSPPTGSDEKKKSANDFYAELQSICSAHGIDSTSADSQASPPGPDGKAADSFYAKLQRLCSAHGIPALPSGSPEKSVDDFYRATFSMKDDQPKRYEALPALDAPLANLVNAMQERLGQLAEVAATPGEPKVPISIPADYVEGARLVHALHAGALSGKSATESADPSAKYRELLGTQRPSQDVLACLQGNWSINRFVTLNYDHEIERQLEDHTYPFFSLTPERGTGTGKATADCTAGGKPTTYGRTARSRLGESAVTIDLCPSNTAELLLFAANFSPAHVQVMHLHGSVRDPSTMIVTDRDYNQRYFSHGAWPSVLGDGQELLFRGNAILFVGVGMNEDELLRPLRILAQAPTRDGRPVFTLLASSSEEEDTALAVKLFQRYGIRTIFYGRVPSHDYEFGDLRDHPLHLAYRRHCGVSEDDGATGATPEDLAPLCDELDFLDSVQCVINAREAVIGAGPPNKSEDSAAAVESCKKYDVAVVELNRAVKSRSKADNKPDDSRIGRFAAIPTLNLPRLRLTHWHADVFALVSLCMENKQFRALNVDQLTALAGAVARLKSAIHTRALLDALDFIALRARDWRRSWSRYPGYAHCPPAFRRLPDSSPFPPLLRRHIGMHHNLGVAPAFIAHSNSAPIGDAQLQEMSFRSQHVVICQWPGGKGKGYLASLLACDPVKKAARRVVISFNQSWEFDSCFDLIADLIRRSDDDARCRFDCVLTHLDAIFSKAAQRPLLVEWDAVLRRLVDRVTRKKQIRLIVVCEYPGTRDYFASIAGEGTHLAHVYGIPAQASKTRPGKAGRTGTGTDDQTSDLDHIFTRCKSRWLMLFLCQLIDWVEQHGRRRTPEPAGQPGSVTGDCLLAAETQPGEFGRRLIDDAWNRLRQTQDPRHRVAAVIDVAIVHFERHVIAYGSPPVRLQKILAFAILRNLFVLAAPVRPELIQYFPEIQNILEDYGMRAHSELLINDAVLLLEHLRLVIPLHGHYPATQAQGRRIGLHGGTRRYLLSKKSLPFTQFGRREHAAITVLPVLAEDVVALEPDDFEFTRKLFRGLIDAANKTISEQEKRQVTSGANDGDDEHRVLPAECIRAAFGLLRGSLRLGVVLRAAEIARPEHSPLDDYFRQLLSIRRAALRIADCDDPNCEEPSVGCEIDEPEGDKPKGKARIFAWPLYEREWVWLFNEMGVVRLLQGDMRDACALLEQAIDFEEKRLRRDAGFECLLYQGSGKKRFSVTRLRIFMNLSTAALERGAFDRVSRIVERDIANLQLNLADFAPGGATARIGKQQHTQAAEAGSSLPHRELEILTLVAGLIGARVQYLQGAIGGAEAWLRAQRRQVLKVGVHGLTAAFFKVYADVQQRKGDVARTMKYLAVARTEAQASCRTDVILGVMLAEAEQARDTQAAESALQLRHHLGRLRKIEGEAQRIGLTQVEATVCLVRARLYLGFGEYRSAREDIMKALTMTTSKGMRVKRIAALVILAALMATEDTTDTARHEALQLLSTARAEAERMGYKLAAINAMELEIVLNRRGSVEDWATSRARVAMDARTASSVAG